MFCGQLFEPAPDDAVGNYFNNHRPACGKLVGYRFSQPAVGLFLETPPVAAGQPGEASVQGAQWAADPLAGLIPGQDNSADALA